jgi:hypothetical protein
MNTITLTINDKSIDKRFTQYLEGKAVKYFPFHVIQSLLFLVFVAVESGFTIRLILSSFYFICSVIGLIMARRLKWTVSYSTILCTEIPIINLIL